MNFEVYSDNLLNFSEETTNATAEILTDDTFDAAS
jgi:hypothetical protein